MKYYEESKRKIISYIQYNKGRLTGLVTLRRNCLLKHVVEGKIEEVTVRRGRRRKQLQDDLKERYWNLKEEALDRTLWRIRLGRGYRPVVRQTTKRMDE